MEEILRKLSESVSNECSIYCDDFDFDADDYDFEYTQDEFGNWNDTYEFIKEQNGCCVIAWEWENGFPNESEMGDILPNLISGFATLRYKKGSAEVWEWKTTFEGRDCKVLKFRIDENKNGWSYYSFWYLVSFEE